MKKQVIVLLIIASLFFLFSCGGGKTTAAGPVKAKTYTWRIQSHAAAGGDLFKIGVKGVAEKLEEVSGGQLKIKLFSGGEVVPAGKEFDGVNDGILDASITTTMNQLNRFKAASLFAQVSGGLTPVQQMFWYWQGGGIDLANEMYAKTNVSFAGMALCRPGEVWVHSKKELKSVKDLSSFKLRTAGEGGEILAKLGVAVVTLSPNEIYESTQRGVIDAFEFAGWNLGYSLGFAEVAKYNYVSASRAPTDPYIMLVNKNSWNKLPKDLQELISTTLKATSADFYAWAIKKEAEALEKWKADGAKVEMLPEDIDQKFSETAKAHYMEKAQKDEFYAKVLKSIFDFKEICEAQDIR